MTNKQSSCLIARHYTQARGRGLCIDVVTLAPVADQDEGGPEVWVREGRGFVGDDEVAADAALRGCACVCLRAVQQRELRLPECFGFERADLGVAQLIKILHQQARAAIRDGPETGDDRL